MDNNFYGTQPTPPQQPMQPVQPIQPMLQPMQPMQQQPMAQPLQAPGTPKSSSKTPFIIAGAAIGGLVLIGILVMLLLPRGGNVLSGRWACSYYSINSGAVSSSPSTLLELNSNNSYKIADYAAPDKNYYAGNSYKVEELSKDSSDGKHYNISFGPYTKEVINGVEETPSGSTGDAEAVLLNNTTKKTMVVFLDGGYTAYYCTAE